MRQTEDDVAPGPSQKNALIAQIAGTMEIGRDRMNFQPSQRSQVTGMRVPDGENRRCEL